jgi:transposase
MEHLDEVPIEELHEALDAVECKRPVQRVLAAIAYKRGVTQTELAEWNDVERKTIYSWLMRFDTDGDLPSAATDGHRSGRRRKLSEEQLRAFERTVREPPTAVGIDEQAWTPALVQQHVADRYGVEYSLPSCRRLLKEAGLRYRRPRLGESGGDGGRQRDVHGDPGSDEKRWTPRSGGT